ncbi:hypothetical protein [Paenibacillus sp. FSL H7-0331]|nr:hypothetical protein [Paenibacillus sp. FSL H7-0331]
MGITFQGFKGNSMKGGLIWQESDSLFPFTCIYLPARVPHGR